MHFAFMPYGIKNFVDFIIEDLNHKYLPLKLYKEGEKDVFMWVQVQVRYLPLGFYEIIFPKEFKNEVLSALINRSGLENNYKKILDNKVLGLHPLSLLRKAFGLKEVEYEEVKSNAFIMPEYLKFVAIMPLGIKEDEEIIEPDGQYKGWKHEAI